MSKYSMSEVGSRKKSSSVVRAVFFVFMLLVLYMPILILALYSFTDAIYPTELSHPVYF